MQEPTAQMILATSLVPELARDLAGARAGLVATQINAVLEDVVGSSDAAFAQQAIRSNPIVAAQLTQRLQAILGATPPSATHSGPPTIAHPSQAHGEIFPTNRLIDLAPLIMSILITSGCIGFFGWILLVSQGERDHTTSNLLHLILGSLVAMLSTTVNYWFASRSSPTAAERLSASQQAQQAEMMTRLSQSVRDNAQQNNELIRSIAATATRPTDGYLAPAITGTAKPIDVFAAAAGAKAADFNISIAVVLREEGGFVDNPEDPGGATNMGITLRALTAWRHRPTSIEDIRTLTVAEAERIYRAHYWNAMDCDALPAGVDLMVFDFGVNAGPEEAVRALQRAVGTTEDGMMGPITLAAVARRNPADLTDRLAGERLQFYRGLSTFGTFGEGWTRRVEEVKAASLRLIS